MPTCSRGWFHLTLTSSVRELPRTVHPPVAPAHKLSSCSTPSSCPSSFPPVSVYAVPQGDGALRVSQGPAAAHHHLHDQAGAGGHAAPGLPGGSQEGVAPHGGSAPRGWFLQAGSAAVNPWCLQGCRQEQEGISARGAGYGRVGPRNGSIDGGRASLPTSGSGLDPHGTEGC